jgi:phage FluMu protein Com
MNGNERKAKLIQFLAAHNVIKCPICGNAGDNEHPAFIPISIQTPYTDFVNGGSIFGLNNKPSLALRCTECNYILLFAGDKIAEILS